VKRPFISAAALALVLIFAVGCGGVSKSSLSPEGPASPEGSKAPPIPDVVEIREKMFVAMTNEIYINSVDYLGKTIKYEGIFQDYYWGEKGSTYYSVFRYGPGCCGTDANCGFEIIWPDGGEYAQTDDWVEVVGTLEEYEEDGYSYLRLALISLEKKSERGLETVTQ
jgi:uncharacterized membrane protein YcgQ (UPF0703/DUF1980 family)